MQLEEGIEGLVHVSEISKEKIKTPVGTYQVGDTLKAIVINVSAKDRKIGLSIKTLEEDSEEAPSKGRTAAKSESAPAAAAEATAPATLGDLFGRSQWSGKLKGLRCTSEDRTFCFFPTGR